LRIATCQFPVSSDIQRNRSFIVGQIHEAREQNCDVVHFPEGALSGYAGIDFSSFDNFNWPLLKDCTNTILWLAAELNIWVLLGSAHPLTATNKPHNSVYIINNIGAIEDRYDKLFCAGDVSGNTGDLAHYSPGDHFSIFSIKGITCSIAICHDYRYPELYRELKKKEVELVFHSFHAGNMNSERQKLMEDEVGERYHHLNPGKTYPEITMPATMISYAANNYFWISCSNTSAKESCWSSFILRPDGVIIGRLEKNEASVLITEIDTETSYYDSTRFWRERAINSIFHSGEHVSDPRSAERKVL